MKKEAIKRWWNEESETFSMLCATKDGETFTHGQVVLANLGVVALILACGIAGWLEGGAAW